MKRIFMAIAIFSFALFAYGQEDTIIGNLYRNNKHAFRIKFPVGWQINNCDGMHMVKKAVDNDGSSVVVGVFPFEDTTGIDFDNLTDSDFNDFYSSITPTLIIGMSKKFSNAKVLEQGVRHLDNRRAIYIKMSGNYRYLDRSLKMINLSYIIPFKEKFYSVGGAASYDLFHEKEKLINLAAASFVIEDYTPMQLADTSITSLITEDKDKFKFNWPEIVFNIVFTWIVGLLLPIVLRFVILKRPIKKKLHAFLLTFLFWFINITFFIAIGSKSKTHGALVLIAIVSYYILYGFKRYSCESNAAKENNDTPVQNSIDSKFVKEVKITDKQLKFICPVCDKAIISNYCNKGDKILCRNCNNRVTIPDNAEFVV